MSEQQFYESVAGEINLWELDRRQNRYFQDMIRYDNILKLIPPKPLKILDLGCGDGYLSYLLAGEGHQVTALDLSPTRLEKFKTVAQQYGIEQIIGDVKQTGLPSQNFDLIVSSEVLEHITGYQEVILEARRLLKTNGLLIVTVPHDEPTKILTCPHCLKKFYRDGHVNRFNRINLPAALTEEALQVVKVTVARSKILNQLQYHLKLKYGAALKLTDRLLCALFPRQTLYLIVVARKSNS